jgi:FolB domain-containing protein
VTGGKELDKIFIKDLRVFGYHGYLPEEREKGQDFVIDILMSLDLRAAGKSDDINDTVDYREVINLVSEIVSRERFSLIEALAERITAAILSSFKVTKVKLDVKKTEAPLEQAVGFVGVRISRASQPS